MCWVGVEVIDNYFHVGRMPGATENTLALADTMGNQKQRHSHENDNKIKTQ